MANIFIVEDDQFLRDLYQDLLEQEQYKVTTAQNGEEALDVIHHHDFDLMLLDIMMPKKDGLTVLKEMSADDKKRAGQVVMLSNLGQEALIKEAIAAGASSYLIKSALAPDQILSEIKDLLASQKT
jgi:two-component system response regulator ResD